MFKGHILKSWKSIAYKFQGKIALSGYHVAKNLILDNENFSDKVKVELETDKESNVKTCIFFPIGRK